MLARPLAPSAASWMKFDPAASCTSSAGVSCHIVQSVVYANATVSATVTPLITSFASRSVRGQAAERVAPDQPIRPRRLRLHAPGDRLAHTRIAVGEAGAGVAGDRGAPLPRVNLAVDGGESRLVLLDDHARLDRVSAAPSGGRRRRSPPPRRASPPPVPARRPPPPIPPVPSSGTPTRLRRRSRRPFPYCRRRRASTCRRRTSSRRRPASTGRTAGKRRPSFRPDSCPSRPERFSAPGDRRRIASGRPGIPRPSIPPAT